MKTPNHSSCPHGIASSNTCKSNSLYSNVLPKSTSPLCRSIFAFTRRLLDLTTPSSDIWKTAPNEEELAIGGGLPSSIFLHPIDPIPDSACPLPCKKIPPVFRNIFLNHLAQSKFPGFTFSWEHPWDLAWNQNFAQFILKHWQHAYQSGVFKFYYLDPVEASNTTIQMGILHRWFLGQSNGIRLGRFSPTRHISKSTSEAKSRLLMQASSEYVLCSSLMWKLTLPPHFL